MSSNPKDQRANLSRGPCEHGLVEDLYVSGKNRSLKPIRISATQWSDRGGLSVFP